ncbi:hypothetical protein M4D49_13035 [Cupriavidus pauculus]|uniref:hypothetical protein n=1 Tax=Cupriavidus pauculus TaxID=82633 RepID=UPI0007850C7C|nr:hypothetical protein [Cupriavidus pauculus]MBY4732252.1 hypothetical protein [Cupriavidus pauculus]MCM3606416.1 hypothetical protein [Cupriavidus pauculus]
MKKQLSLIALVALAGCAPMIQSAPVDLTPLTESAATPAIRFENNADLRLDTGYTRMLASSSIWKPVGRLPQGTVYRPAGTVFTIEGRQVHEAYLVIQDKQLVGFYLPGEQTYSPLSTAVPITTGEIQ